MNFVDNLNIMNIDRRSIYVPNKVHLEIVQQFKDRLLAEFEQAGKKYPGDKSLTDQFIEQLNNLTPQNAYKFMNDLWIKLDPDSEYSYSHTLIDINLLYDIERSYKEIDYEFMYYAWINPKNPKILALKREIKLSPQTFEIAADLTLDQYRAGLNRLSQDTPKYGHDQSSFAGIRSWNKLAGQRSSFAGWNKEDLVDAIRKSGLPLVQYMGLNVLRGNRIRLDSIPLKALDLPNQKPAFRPNYVLPGIRDPAYMRRVHHHVGLTAYMPRSYYETLYRWIYRTLDYVNWKQICRVKGSSLGALQFIAIEDFSLDPKQILQMDYNQVCRTLQDEANRRRSTVREIAKEAAEVAPSLILQPGSVFVRPEQLQYEERLENIPEAYEEVIDACLDENTTKGYLIFLANRMGIRQLLPQNLGQIPKERICKIMLDYIRRIERTKRPY